MGPGPISGDLGQQNGAPRNMPILPSSSKPVSPGSHGDPMDVTPSASTSMGPPVNSSPEVDTHAMTNGGAAEFAVNQNASHGNAMTAAAATSSQQPKMVNTAFIHKLYKYVCSRTLVDISIDVPLACWRIRRYTNLSHGPLMERGFSCLPPLSSRKSLRKSLFERSSFTNHS